MLCQGVMKVNSIRQGVFHHIGGRRCQKLTSYALELCKSIDADERGKGVKRKYENLSTDGHKSTRKSPQIVTTVSRRTHGTNHFEDINRDLDQVLIVACEIRALHQRKDNLNQDVNKIMQLVGSIRSSVDQVAGSFGVSDVASQVIPGVNVSPPHTEDVVEPPAPAPGDGQDQ